MSFSLFFFKLGGLTLRSSFLLVNQLGLVTPGKKKIEVVKHAKCLEMLRLLNKIGLFALAEGRVEIWGECENE